MKEFKIQRMTMEEFKLKYNLGERQGEGDFPRSYSVSELGNIMGMSNEDKTYILVEDRLYEVLNEVDGEGSTGKLLSQDEVETIERINEDFRDSLISLREQLYHGGGLGSEKVKDIRLAMNRCINGAKEILDKNNIKDRDKLKGVSNKYFVEEFLGGLFGDEKYQLEDEIDCGL